MTHFYTTEYEYITVEKREKVALITLNRPKVSMGTSSSWHFVRFLMLSIVHGIQALNALCDGLMKELNTATQLYDEDESVGAMVITGSDKAFAGKKSESHPLTLRDIHIFDSATAGADIKEMKDKTYMECYKENFLANWANLMKIRKPVRERDGRLILRSRTCACHAFCLFTCQPHTDHCCCKWVCSRRRMRIGNDV